MVAIAIVAAVAGGGALGACAPSTSGAPCSPGDLAQENGHILRCKDGRFVAGESLEEFVKSFLRELELKARIKIEPAPQPCPEATEAGTDSYTPGCPSPSPSPCPDAAATGVEAYRPGC